MWDVPNQKYFILFVLLLSTGLRYSHAYPNENGECATITAIKEFKERVKANPDNAGIARDSIIPRPSVPANNYIDSDNHPVRVHYMYTSYYNQALDVVSYLDYSWGYMVDVLGYDPPLSDDNGGGNSSLDVYLDLIDDYDAVGLTVPIDLSSDLTRTACYTFIILDPRMTDSKLMVTTAHELHHAIQMAMDCWESASFFENTAVYMEDTVYSDTNEYLPFLGFFQQKPYRGIELGTEVNMGYPYGGMLVPMLLDQAYGDGDGKLLADLWRRTIQARGAFSSPINEPDYFDIIGEIVAEAGGAGLDDYLLNLAEWRYLTGSHDDGQHYKDAGIMQGVECRISGFHYTCDVDVDSTVQLGTSSGSTVSGTLHQGLNPHGMGYVEISLATSMNGYLDILIDGDDATRWGGKVICQGTTKNDGYPTTMISPILMDTEQKTGHVLMGISNFATCTLAIANLGPISYDVDARDAIADVYHNISYGVEYNAEDLPTPSITGFAPRSDSCEGGSYMTISGENFNGGLQVHFGDSSATIVQLNADTITVVIPTTSESQNVEISITTSSGETITASGEFSYLGDGCSCSCDETYSCDYRCPCDPECIDCTCDKTYGCDWPCDCDVECKECVCNETTSCDADCPCDPECQRDPGDLDPNCWCDSTYECDGECDCDQDCSGCGCYSHAQPPLSEALLVIMLMLVFAKKRKYI